jgi:hypothetical protein
LNFKEDEAAFLSRLRIHKKQLTLDESIMIISAPEAGSFLSIHKTPASAVGPADNATNGVEKPYPKDGTPGSSGEGIEFPAWSSMVSSCENPQDLHFIPYFARANRGGSGMMRVGIRTV